MATLIELMDDYTGGLGWEWGKRDCIGLMFKVVNASTGKSLNRSEYLPAHLGYREACEWLGRHTSPLHPYIDFMSKAGITPSVKPAGSHISIVYGGKPLLSKGEAYPVKPVPGLVFADSNGQEYAFFVGGLRAVVLYSEPTRKIIKYPLTGIR